jgi:HD superfamily phosphohydrolase YqeK
MNYLYDAYKQRFQKYYESVEPISERHDEVNKLKYHHTFRVVHEIIKLSEHHNLTANEVILAKLIALFHDVGRFEQYARYKTFSDKDSVDHAELAIQIIEENNLLHGIEQQDYEFIKTAILNHNKLAISDNLTEEQLFYSKLIRDADKLDILYVVTSNKRYYVPDDAKENLTDLNPNFVDDIINHRLVSYNDVKGMLDYVLLRISWVYDLYFDYTILQFKERGYFQKMLNQLPESEQKVEIESAINDFIEQKTTQSIF